MMTTTGTFQDVIEARVRAIFERSKDEQASELYYGIMGLVDYEPDVPNEQMNDMSGPDRGTLTVEGQEYGANKKYRGYPVTLTLRKYTFKLNWTEEDVHWMQKQSSSKRKSELNNAAVGAVNALQQNINEDTCRVFYQGFGTTFLTVGRGIIAHAKSSLINGETPNAKARTTLSKQIAKIKTAIGQLQRLSERTIFNNIEATV
jgi:hypothetical protein